jgi:uncharacterized membrane protein YjjP (DUF1212 family)
MRNLFQKQVLILALFAGELMMKSGAEIYRVEDTIERICRACRIDYVECFATTTGIFLSLDSGRDENDMHTFIKRIHNSEINLDKISKINQFSRDFTATDLSVEMGMDRLRVIAAQKAPNFMLQLLGAILVGAFLCPGFGGRPLDIVFAALASGVSYCVSFAIERLRFADFIRILIGCAACALFTILLSLLVPGIYISAVIISGTAIFMPGVAITNAARDLLSGDMLSGVARFAEALVTAIAIAGGVGLLLKLWMLGGGSYLVNPSPWYPLPFSFLFGLVATGGFCILFNAPKNLYILISIIGGVGMLAKGALLAFDYGTIIACFVGTCIIAILSEMCSRAGKEATTIFILPGIIPFVPGSVLYKTMEGMLNGNFTDAIALGSEALVIAGSIAVALILIASMTRLVLALIRRIKRIFERWRWKR